VVLVAVLTALWLARGHDSFFANGALLLGPVLAGVVVAVAWPYFPVLDLFVAQPPEFHGFGRVFYQGVAVQVWPAIVAFPVVVWRLRRNRRDPLALIVVLLTVVYAIGALAGENGLGRVIAYIVVFVHVALAAAVAAWESRLPAKRAWVAAGCALIVAVGFVAYNRAPLRRIVRDARPPWQEIERVLAPVGPGDVVLTDSRTSYVVPALTGGRVVAWRHPIYWVPDHTERRHAVERFFATAPDEERRAVIARYGVRWVLLDRRRVPLDLEEEARLMSLGSVVAERESLLLVDLGATPAAQRQGGRPSALATR
jgi:alpha-1,6-mannosyltransferase